jgi:hypothetical protein
MPKGVPRKVTSKNLTDAVNHPVMHGAVSTDDLRDPELINSATASLNHLVDSTVLRPETDDEDVVLASPADLKKSYMADLQFNEEIVEITIAEDNSEFPVDPVWVSCNGKEKFIYRGEPTKIARKFVECLCNPLVRVSTKQKKNNLGEDETDIVQSRSLQYPFQIIDPNPKGKAWLRALMRRG